MPIAAVDLFCGVGGMTHGFVQQGFRVVAGLDVDTSCKFAYEKNNDGARFLPWDVATVQPQSVADLFPANHIRVLAGCAPCQPYSLYSNRKSTDNKWKLLHSFADLATTIEPEVITMENVTRLERHNVFRDFVSRLEKTGYCVTHFVARGPDYGIPQRRNRLVLFASRFGPIELIPPTHPTHKGTTLRDAIGALPAIEAGGQHPRDPLHRSRNLSPRNLARMRATPAGGSWADWDEELQLECHKKQSGATFGSVYGRCEWSKPGPVITTQFIGVGNGRFGHPEQDRALSLREAAVIQTFPRNYRFIDPSSKKISMQSIARQIGNAVPVRLGRIVARSIERHLRVVGALT